MPLKRTKPFRSAQGGLLLQYVYPSFYNLVQGDIFNLCLLLRLARQGANSRLDSLGISKFRENLLGLPDGLSSLRCPTGFQQPGLNEWEKRGIHPVEAELILW